MRRVREAFLGFCCAACVTAPASDYVPGGGGLPQETARSYDRLRKALRQDRVEDALALVDALSRRHPLHLGIHLARLRLWRKHRGADAALGLYRPPPPGVDPERARVFGELVSLGAEDIAARRALLTFASTQEPREPLWLVGLAEVDVRACENIVVRAERQRELGEVDLSAESMVEARGLLTRARENAQKALDLASDVVEAYLVLGYVATKAADLSNSLQEADTLRDEAGRHYQEAVDRNPASVQGRVNLAENHLFFDRYKLAVHHLKFAVLLGPREPAAWSNLGLALFRRGKAKGALEAYDKALELVPDRVDLRIARADCLIRLGRPEEGRQALEDARGRAGENREILADVAFRLGVLHEKARRYREAVEEYRKHIDLRGAESGKAEFRIRTIFETAFED